MWTMTFTGRRFRNGPADKGEIRSGRAMSGMFFGMTSTDLTGLLKWGALPVTGSMARA